jgi:ethanolamine ammonia-lyase small subunit
VDADPWGTLKAYTRARIALGRAGNSIPTDEVLRFGYAHAAARDAVHIPLDVALLEQALRQAGFDTLQVQSAAPDRHTYLLRPDLGRRLNDDSASVLAAHPQKAYDLLLLVGDGLSSLAVKNHALPVLEEIRRMAPSAWKIAPVVIATQARVALSDEVGALLNARVVLMLVGERPGLSSPDSLGIYLTYEPRTGRQDSERNCISNVRPEGLDYHAAAAKAVWLAGEAMTLRLSGIGLKDQSEMPAIPTGSDGITSLP